VSLNANVNKKEGKPPKEKGGGVKKRERMKRTLEDGGPMKMSGLKKSSLMRRNNSRIAMPGGRFVRREVFDIQALSPPKKGLFLVRHQHQQHSQYQHKFDANSLFPPCAQLRYECCAPRRG
jgi:hypothetical protein